MLAFAALLLLMLAALAIVAAAPSLDRPWHIHAARAAFTALVVAAYAVALLA